MKIAVTLGLSLALAPTVAAQHETVVRTTLSQIRTSPDAYRDVWVRFAVQFASLGKVQNPFFTLFEPSKFANFYGWADEQEIWQQEKFEDLFGLFFVAKQSEICADLYQMKVYDRVEVVGIVRNVFQGQPWVEITEMTPLGERVNTTTLSHLYRGESWMKKRDWNRAIAELSLAPGENLPNHVRGHIHKDLAMCYLRLGEANTAIQHLENAVELTKGIDADIRQMAAMAKVKPETFLDRTLSNAQVEEHRRPMWEAFEVKTSEGDEAAPSPVGNQPAPTAGR